METVSNLVDLYEQEHESEPPGSRLRRQSGATQEFVGNDLAEEKVHGIRIPQIADLAIFEKAAVEGQWAGISAKNQAKDD